MLLRRHPQEPVLRWGHRSRYVCVRIQPLNAHATSVTEIAVQTLIVFLGGDVFSVTRLGGREWAISLALGVVSIPLGALIRLAPNAPCQRVFGLLRLYREPEVLPTAQHPRDSVGRADPASLRACGREF